ncbi:hypothetical protein ACFY2Z_25390 [Streptomyces sp. NPDC001222]|uniref:hypothetical protein n=1 Tax=Streptomyces sp. NPDC001222 TaxID=3364548 RepID=UPI0036B8F7FD
MHEDATRAAWGPGPVASRRRLWRAAETLSILITNLLEPAFDRSDALVNHTPRPLTGVTVSARCFDLSGHLLAPEQRKTVDVAASATADVFTAGWDGGLLAFHLLRLRLTDSAGRVPAENTYRRYRDARDMTALNRARPDPGRRGHHPHRPLEVPSWPDRASPQPGCGGRGHGACLAPRRRERSTGPPDALSDNHLWLLPGESRDLTLSWPAGALASGRAEVRVEGHNLPEASVRTAAL